jgi:hypothetical protein
VRLGTERRVDAFPAHDIEPKSRTASTEPGAAADTRPGAAAATGA